MILIGSGTKDAHLKRGKREGRLLLVGAELRPIARERNATFLNPCGIQPGPGKVKRREVVRTAIGDDDHLVRASQGPASYPAID